MLHPHVEKVLSHLLGQDCPLLINVNLPRKPREMLWTHQSVRSYDGKVVVGQDPYGRKHYWFVSTPSTQVDENSDRWAVEHGRISLTPLRLDLTDEKWLQMQHQEIE